MRALALRVIGSAPFMANRTSARFPPAGLWAAAGIWHWAGNFGAPKRRNPMWKRALRWEGVDADNVGGALMSIS